MIYVYFTGRIKDKRKIIEASELMLAELCVNCDYDVDIDVCLLRHLDQQMARPNRGTGERTGNATQ